MTHSQWKDIFFPTQKEESPFSALILTSFLVVAIINFFTNFSSQKFSPSLILLFLTTYLFLKYVVAPIFYRYQIAKVLDYLIDTHELIVTPMEQKMVHGLRRLGYVVDVDDEKKDTDTEDFFVERSPLYHFLQTIPHPSLAEWEAENKDKSIYEKVTSLHHILMRIYVVYLDHAQLRQDEVGVSYMQLSNVQFLLDKYRFIYPKLFKHTSYRQKDYQYKDSIHFLDLTRCLEKKGR